MSVPRKLTRSVSQGERFTRHRLRIIVVGTLALADASG